MSKDYVMQLEATIQNLRRDNALLKELNTKYKDLEEQIGCSLEVFVKLLFEQKIWIEVDGVMYLTEYIDFSVELELQKDETWINTLEDYGEAEFWAWYMDYRRFSCHIVLRLKDYKKTWWLKKDRSE